VGQQISIQSRENEIALDLLPPRPFSQSTRNCSDMAPTHSRKAKAATHVTDTVSAPTKTAESIASKAIKAIGAEINKSNAGKLSAIVQYENA
jgi:hypothetical protein